MLEDFRQVTLKNSRAHSKSTPESTRPPQPSGQVRHCRGQWGRLSLSFPELSHGKAPRDPNGDRAYFRLTGGSRVRYGSSGTGSLQRSHPPARASQATASPGLAAQSRQSLRRLDPSCHLGASSQAGSPRRGAAPQPPRSRNAFPPRRAARPHLTRSLQLQPLAVHPQAPQAPAPAGRELPRAQRIGLAHSPLGTGLGQRSATSQTPAAFPCPGPHHN